MKDFCLDDSKIFVSDERELILQQIDILFDTHDGDILGESWGTKFEDFLWDLKMSASDISAYTEDVIRTNVSLFGWHVNVETDILQGSQNDIILITIKLSNELKKKKKTYKVD